MSVVTVTEPTLSQNLHCNQKSKNVTIMSKQVTNAYKIRGSEQKFVKTDPASHNKQMKKIYDIGSLTLGSNIFLF